MATTHRDTGLRIEPGGLPQEFKQHGKTEADVNAFLEALDDESDRGLILTLAAVLDDICKEWLQDIFNHGNRKARDDLFGSNGAFATFSSRLKALYCLGKLSDALYADVNTLRGLRNEAAHEWANFNFDNPAIRSKVEALVARAPIEKHESDLDLRFRLKFHGWMLMVGLLGRGAQPNQSPMA